MRKNAVNIKGTKGGLVILLDPSREFDDIKCHLQQKMESANGFFQGATVTFTGKDKLVPRQQHELESICRQYGLIPDSSPAAPEIESLFTPPPEKKSSFPDLPGEPAMLLKRTLRSGQFISHPAHVVILGNVHPGAKVEAGGSIMIMGNCLGTVHAGKGGDRKAIISALDLSPQVLRIADLTYIAPPASKGARKAGAPQRAFIQDGRITIIPG